LTKQLLPFTIIITNPIFLVKINLGGENMKKIAAVLMVLLLTISLLGCSQDDSNDSSSGNSNGGKGLLSLFSKDKENSDNPEGVTSDQKQDSKSLLTDDEESNLTPEQESLLGYAFHTYILWVPGVSYTVDDYNANTSTLYSSPGSVPKSTITVKRDGTYVWNSYWDDRVITGNWTNNPDGAINILNGQEGKDWILMENDKDPGIYLSDGSIYYQGQQVTVKSK
jgi:hypothetical protein